MASPNKLVKRHILSSLNMYQSNIMEKSTTPNCPSCNNILNMVEIKYTELNNSINELKDNIRLQNEAIMSALATQKVLTQKLIQQDNNNQNVRNYFPMKSGEDLRALNQLINDENIQTVVNIMKSLLKRRLPKTLPEVLSIDSIIDINIDGTHGNKRLKDFANVFECLMDAVRSLCADPEKEFRKALQVIKKSHFHNVCLQNKAKK